jgi:CrcB protein
MIGATLRYLVNTIIDAGEFPFGTLTVNVVGSFALGFVTALGVGEPAVLFVGTGICGSFTTFSSFSFETVRLWEEDERRLAVTYAFGTLLAAGIGIGLGWLLAG